MQAINLGSKLGENLIINPTFDIWQRANSFTSIAGGSYFADRFLYSKTGAVVHDVNRSADVPTLQQSGFQNKYSALLNVTTADVAIDVGDFSMIHQRIEGYNFRKLAGKNMVLSFWVKATKTGVYCVALRNSSQTKSYVVEYNINQPNTWEKKTIKIKHDTAGTWDYENGLGVDITWALACGSNFHTTPNSWQDGGFLATANQVNGTDAINNEFRIAQVQLHEGIDEIPFSKLIRDFASELQLCQRYFEKSYDIDVPVGTITSAGVFHFLLAQQGTANEARMTSFFAVKKRTIPVAFPYSSSSGTVNRMATDVGDLVSNALFAGVGSFAALIGAGHGTTQSFTYHWTADAEL